MKKAKKILLVLVLMLFINIINVKAIGNISINWQYDNDLNNSSKLWLEGDLDDSKGYFVKFVKDGETAPSIPSNRFNVEKGMMPDNEFDLNKWFVADNAGTLKSYKINIYNNFYMYADYNGAYVIECSDTSCTMSSRLKLTKPPLQDYGERYSFHFSNSKLSIDPKYQTGYLVFDIDIKLGVIEDKDLFNKVIKDYDGSRLELLEYAKSASNGTIFKSKTFNDVPIGDYNIQECKLYYAYVENDNSNGKYVSVPDVYAVLGSNDIVDGSLVLSNDFSYYEEYCNIKPAQNVSNPKTADSNLLIIISLVVITMVVLGVSLNKLRKSRSN